MQQKTTYPLVRFQPALGDEALAARVARVGFGLQRGVERAEVRHEEALGRKALCQGGVSFLLRIN
jgi:hypothetical protein